MNREDFDRGPYPGVGCGRLMSEREYREQVVCNYCAPTDPNSDSEKDGMVWRIVQ
jgi:hypothetical protein